MADLKWYVVRQVSGQEKKVKEYLENEIAQRKILDQLHSSGLIPSEKVYEMRNGKKACLVKETFFLVILCFRQI